MRAIMRRALPILCLAVLAACGDKTPPRPDEAASARLANMEARLDAAEAADPMTDEDAPPATTAD